MEEETMRPTNKVYSEWDMLEAFKHGKEYEEIIYRDKDGFPCEPPLFLPFYPPAAASTDGKQPGADPPGEF